MQKLDIIIFIIYAFLLGKACWKIDYCIRNFDNYMTDVLSSIALGADVIHNLRMMMHCYMRISVLKLGRYKISIFLTLRLMSMTQCGFSKVIRRYLSFLCSIVILFQYAV